MGLRRKGKGVRSKGAQGRQRTGTLNGGRSVPSSAASRRAYSSSITFDITAVFPQPVGATSRALWLHDALTMALTNASTASAWRGLNVLATSGMVASFAAASIAGSGTDVFLARVVVAAFGFFVAAGRARALTKMRGLVDFSSFVDVVVVVVAVVVVDFFAAASRNVVLACL